LLDKCNGVLQSLSIALILQLASINTLRQSILHFIAAKVLIDANCNINAIDNDCNTPLHLSSKLGMIKSVE
jgi:ankyrin repeat protein